MWRERVASTGKRQRGPGRGRGIVGNGAIGPAGRPEAGMAELAALPDRATLLVGDTRRYTDHARIRRDRAGHARLAAQRDQRLGGGGVVSGGAVVPRGDAGPGQ